MIGFGAILGESLELDGNRVAAINSDLSPVRNFSVRCVLCVLKSNDSLSFEGDQKGGKFDPTETEAICLLTSPNPIGNSSSDVVFPRANAETLVKIRKQYCTKRQRPRIGNSRCALSPQHSWKGLRYRQDQTR